MLYKILLFFFREFRDIPLLTTGGILHAARSSAEAAIVLHTSIDHAPTQSHQHLALGHVYAVLGDYNRSIACYDNSLRLAPTMEQARQAKQVILCRQRLDKSLGALHKWELKKKGQDSLFCSLNFWPIRISFLYQGLWTILSPRCTPIRTTMRTCWSSEKKFCAITQWRFC